MWLIREELIVSFFFSMRDLIALHVTDIFDIVAILSFSFSARYYLIMVLICISQRLVAEHFAIFA